MSGSGVALQLLNTFAVTHDGVRCSLPFSSQRLFAYLALHDHHVQRAGAAEQLWPDCQPQRASGNLRSALCHARHVGHGMTIDSTDQTLALSPTVEVDLHQVSHTARGVAAGARIAPEAAPGLVTDLRGELLPTWTEDWLLLERERWDQLRLHALEKLAQQLTGEQRYVAALHAAFAAVAIDPLRETAHRLIMEVHIAEGNVASALKCYQEYRKLLAAELHIHPSPRMRRLVQDLIPR
ncbi:AfsR/SARP family transcriptional regulator [Streptomyces sp. DSM 41931]|uniref:AfsR/SARP family transcriptional regulator n=1 Tax=Streptomyces sp. DSM 41931 TaxID=3418367 RepID=UPI003CFD77C4